MQSFCSISCLQAASNRLINEYLQLILKPYCDKKMEVVVTLHVPGKAFFSRLLLLSLAVLMGACSSNPVSIGGRTETIKTVGVVTLLPSELKYNKIGITVFNNEYRALAVDNAFNEAARKSAQAVLSKGQRKVIQLDVDVPVLARKLRNSAIVFDSPAEDIREELLQLVKQHQLDAVVIVAELFDRDRGINGVGVAVRTGLGDVRRVVGRADVFTLLVDPNIKKITSQAIGQGFSPKRADNQPWSYRLEENLDAQSHQHNAAEMARAVEASVLYHLQDMGF